MNDLSKWDVTKPDTEVAGQVEPVVRVRTDFSEILEKMRKWDITDPHLSEITGIDRTSLTRIRNTPFRKIRYDTGVAIMDVYDGMTNKCWVCGCETNIGKRHPICDTQLCRDIWEWWHGERDHNYIKQNKIKWLECGKSMVTNELFSLIVIGEYLKWLLRQQQKI